MKGNEILGSAVFVITRQQVSRQTATPIFWYLF